MTPAKASDSRMLDFEMPIREQSALILHTPPMRERPRKMRRGSSRMLKEVFRHPENGKARITWCRKLLSASGNVRAVTRAASCDAVPVAY